MVFILLYGMREDAAFKSQLFQGFAAVAAGSESESAGRDLQKTLKDYMNAQFPYLGAEAEKTEKHMREVLEEQTKQVFRVQRTETPWKRGKA